MKSQQKQKTPFGKLAIFFGIIGTVATIIGLLSFYEASTGIPSSTSQIKAQEKFQVKFEEAQKEFQQKVDVARKEAEQKQAKKTKI